MATLELNNKIGSGSIPLNGIQYLVTDEVDLRINGDRYLKAGYIETDTTNLDVSVIRKGVYFEKASFIDSPLVSADTIVSDNGDIVAYNTSTINYSTDSGQTWNTSTITIPATYNIQSIETDHNGNWVAALGRNNAGYPPAYRISTDSGATWTTLTVTGVTGDSNDHEVMFSRETSEWCIVQTATTGTSSTFAHFSTDLVSWVNQTLSTRLDTAARFIPPTEGNQTWYFKGNDNGNAQGWMIWVNDATGAKTTGTVGFNNTTYPSEFINSPIFYFKNGDLFIGSGSGVDEVRIYRFPALPTSNESKDAGRFYSKTEFDRLEDGQASRQPTMTFENKVYLSDWYTSDGVEFLPLAAETLNKYRRADGKLYAQGQSTDINVESIPVAGSVTPHTKGAASQFVKIQKGV